MNRTCVHGVLILAIALGLTGCNQKIPTWDELTGKKEAEPAPPAPAVSQPPPAPPKPPEVNPAEVIAKFKALKPREIDDRNLVELCSLKEGLEQITEIDATGSGVTNGALVGITNLPKLRVLNLSGTRVDSNALNTVYKCPSLEMLGLNNTSIDGSGLNVLGNIPTFKFLELSGCKLTEAAWNEIGGLQNLEGLWISRTPINNQGMEAICRAKSIQHLSVNETPIADLGLVPLQNLEKLVGLDLGGCPITGEGLAFLNNNIGLKNLKTLSVARNNQLTPAGANLILKIRSLEMLNMAAVTGVNDLYLKQIFSSFPMLKQLEINGAGSNGSISDKGVGLAANAKHLTYLKADHIPTLSDATLKALSKCRELKELHIDGQCTILGAQAFKKARSDCKLVCNGVTY